MVIACSRLDELGLCSSWLVWELRSDASGISEAVKPPTTAVIVLSIDVWVSGGKSRPELKWTVPFNLAAMCKGCRSVGNELAILLPPVACETMAKGAGPVIMVG